LIKVLIKQGFTMNARMQMSMAMQLSSELGRMTQSYNTGLAQLLRAHDVTYPQYAVLDHIMRNGSKAETISQISDAVEVLPPAVTKIVRKFAERGLLQVSGTEKDRRQKRVSMTVEAAAFIGKLQAALMPDVLECFSDWPEEKLDTFAYQIRIFRRWLDENRV
jgi:DNA-binding MarR family transcriptional regulator